MGRMLAVVPALSSFVLGGWNRPQSVKQALSRLLPRRIVAPHFTSATPSAWALERIAEQEQFDSATLLSEVARLLGIPSMFKLSCPTQSMLQRCAVPITDLKAAFAIPQPDSRRPERYRLAVADPDLVAVAEFQRKGIEVVLALATEIARAWNEYESVVADGAFSVALPLRTAEQVVIELVRDAVHLGAHTLWIGKTAPDRYQFPVSRGTFVGRVHPGVYAALVRALQRRGLIVVSPGVPGVGELRLSLLQGEARACVACSWTSQEVTLPLEALGVVESSVEINFTAESDSDALAVAEPLPRARVLLVEDDVVFARLLSDMLTRRGFDVVSRYSRSSAEAWLDENHGVCCAVLSDVHIADGSATHFLEWLRNSFPEIRVAMLSSDEDPELEAEMRSAGADTFVPKQADAQRLLTWLEFVVQSKGQIDEQREAGVAVAADVSLRPDSVQDLPEGQARGVR